VSRSNDVRHLVGILLGMFASSGPALVNWYGHAALPIMTALVIASAGGALAGRILVPPGERMRAHLVAIACGALAGAGAYGATAWWLHRHASVMSMLLILITFIGAAPGAVLGLVLFERIRRPDEKLPQATARTTGSRSG